MEGFMSFTEDLYTSDKFDSLIDFMATKPLEGWVSAVKDLTPKVDDEASPAAAMRKLVRANGAISTLALGDLFE